jgi:hypothetical protein
MTFDFWSPIQYSRLRRTSVSSSVIPAVRTCYSYLRCHLYCACGSSQLFFADRKIRGPGLIDTSLSRCVVESTTRVGCTARMPKKKRSIITVICIAAWALVTTRAAVFFSLIRTKICSLLYY